MKKLLFILTVILSYSTGFCDNPSNINTLVDEINESCPINWDYDCTINEVKFNGYTVSIRMDYGNKKGDFFTTFREDARKNMDQWILSLYKISPVWEKLMNESVANKIHLTLIAYTPNGGVSLKIFPEQIQKVKEMMEKGE